MKLKLKILGVALAAAFALVAISAAAASAAEFHSSTHHTTITSTQTSTHIVITWSGIAIKCTTKTSHSTKQNTTTTTELTASPTYSGCKAFGLSAPVDVNGCAFILTNTGATTVSTDVECSGATKYIAVTAPGCEVRIGPQTGLNTVTLSNIAAGDIEASYNISGLSYEEIGASCAAAGKHSDGTYTGASVLNGNDTATNISYS